MGSDAVGDMLGAFGMLLAAPASVVAVVVTNYQLATFLMATATFMVALSNHDA